MKWSKDQCQAEAIKYNRKIDYLNNSTSYRAAKRNGWIDDICKHMEVRHKKTRSECQEKALECKTRWDFQKNYTSYYNASYHNNWLDEICQHMVRMDHENGYWTKEKCLEEALKYRNRNTFRKMSVSAYNTSRKNKWLDEICQHMQRLIKAQNFWTKEECWKEALNYKTRSDFYNGNQSAYR